MSHDDGPLDLGSVFADREPDARLEERIVADYLRASSRAHARPSPRRWIGLAAGIVLFAAGFGTGRMLSPVAETEPSTSASSARSFMLLLFERADFASQYPPGSLSAEYAAWARELTESGVLIRGSELGPERIVLPPADGVPDETRSFRLGGYFVIEAADETEALRIAEAHPHLGHGGWIEVAEMR